MGELLLFLGGEQVEVARHPHAYLCVHEFLVLQSRLFEEQLQHRFTIINFTVKDIDSALDQTGADIEDNVQFVLARKQKCRVIITNNYKDYRLLLGAQIIKPSKVRTIAR